MEFRSLGTLLILGWLTVHMQHLRAAEANRGVKCFCKTLRTGRELATSEPGYISSAGRSEGGAERDLRPPAACLSSGSPPPGCRLQLSGWFLFSLSELPVSRAVGQNPQICMVCLCCSSMAQAPGPGIKWSAVTAAPPEAVKGISEISKKQSMEKSYSENDCHVLPC